MSVSHVVFLLEEPSLEAALTELLPRLLGDITWEVHQFGGKQRMLKLLPQRLTALSKYLESSHRVVVVLDRDNEECRKLKARVVEMATKARLREKGASTSWQVAVRIAVEELESWFFGDWAAVQAAYPRVPVQVPNKADFRIPDEIKGGTCERLEKILKDAGYFPGGLAKIELARAVAPHMNPARNSSESFCSLRDLLRSL